MSKSFDVVATLNQSTLSSGVWRSRTSSAGDAPISPSALISSSHVIGKQVKQALEAARPIDSASVILSDVVNASADRCEVMFFVCSSLY